MNRDDGAVVLDAIADLATDALAAVLAGNAERVYRIPTAKRTATQPMQAPQKMVANDVTV